MDPQRAELLRNAVTFLSDPQVRLSGVASSLGSDRPAHFYCVLLQII